MVWNENLNVQRSEWATFQRQPCDYDQNSPNKRLEMSEILWLRLIWSTFCIVFTFGSFPWCFLWSCPSSTIAFDASSFWGFAIKVNDLWQDFADFCEFETVIRFSVARFLDQKVATFFTKSSQKVDIFLSDYEIFQNFSKNAHSFKRFSHNSLKSPIFLAIFPQFPKVATNM